MRIEEIKSRLEELIKDRESFMVGDYDKDIYDRDKEALELAIKAVEKQIPKKPDNIYDGYNSIREKQDQRVSEVLDSIIAEIKSDYENNHMPASKELVLTCKLDEEQMQRLKEQIESAKMSIEPVEESKWIKCSDRMPEESDGTVLVCFPDEFPYSNKEPYVNAKHNQRVRTASYSQFNNTWYIGDFCAIGEVRPIAWMPLPKLPKEEK